MIKPSRKERIKTEVIVLMKEGFFDMESGQVIINKHHGIIQNMKFITTPYDRGKLGKKEEVVDKPS